jgi:hypothetical protein
MYFLLLSTLWSCRKETSTENPNGVNPGTAAGSFTAQIDGVTWTAADSAKGASILGGQIILIGISSDNQQMSITLSDTVPGVYTLNQTSASLAAYGSNDSSSQYLFASYKGSDTSQAGGTVTVTEIDKTNQTISGTFSFKLYRDIDGHQKTVKNGVFNKLPYISSLPPAGNGDTLTANIDGVNWSAESILASALSNQLIISGSALDGSKSVELVMPLDILPGSYTLDYRGLTYYGLYNPVTTVGLASAAGNLTILANESSIHRVRGTFQFQAIDPLGLGNPPHQLNNGYFSVTYN